MTFQIQQQEKKMWCWAAVAASVDHYFTPASNSTQCAIASQLFMKNCAATKDACDEAWYLEEALEDVGRLNGVPQKGTLDFDAIQAQIAAGLPVCIRIGWNGGGGHFLVISGCGVNESGQEAILISDPFYGKSTWQANSFKIGYQSTVGRWTHTYLVKR
jgi:hypothetical protein